MSGRHATAAELEAYVMGALAGSSAEALEDHAAACDACAAALAREASLEIAFEQVAKQAAQVPVARPVRAATYGAVGFLAVAAAVVVWLGRAPGPQGTAASGGAESGPGIAAHAPLSDGAVILDARLDTLDGG
jgi:anti-sigma factor RsiW